jgi:ABC-type Mn2+/Zn2+ transport system ATPase subunit
MIAPAVINARDVFAGYGKAPVLKGLSLTVEEGSMTGLCGSNGAGKSTFLKLCLGMLRPEGGSLSVLGKTPGRLLFRNTLLRIGYVPQNTYGGSLPVTVREAVSMGRYGKAGFFRPLSRKDRECVNVAMEAAGITELSMRRVQDLSGGQTQKVAIARALSMEPDILLLDEPTSSLDQESRMELLKTIRFQQKYRRITAVIVSHNAETLAECETIYCFAQGKAEKLAVKDERNA